MKNHLKVTFFGDSICTGQHVAIHQGWVTRSSASLARKFAQENQEIVVTNSSVNGRTTRQALETISYEIQSHAPDIVIVQFGMNDCNYWKTDKGLPRVSYDSFTANLTEIINRILHFGAQKVFINTNHPTLLNKVKFPNTKITYQQSNNHYNEGIRSVAHNTQVELNDVETDIFKKIEQKKCSLDELLLPSDLLHLSKKGHDLYYTFIYPKIENAVRDLLSK